MDYFFEVDSFGFFFFFNFYVMIDRFGVVSWDFMLGFYVKIKCPSKP